MTARWPSTTSHCHIYIEAGWWDRLPPAAATEVEMLDFAIDTAVNSRLACQVLASDALDGLTVRMPALQS